MKVDEKVVNDILSNISNNLKLTDEQIKRVVEIRDYHLKDKLLKGTASLDEKPLEEKEVTSISHLDHYSYTQGLQDGMKAERDGVTHKDEKVNSELEDNIKNKRGCGEPIPTGVPPYIWTCSKPCGAGGYLCKKCQKSKDEKKSQVEMGFTKIDDFCPQCDFGVSECMCDESSKEDEIKEIEDALSHGQDGSPLQELANIPMRKRLKELKSGTSNHGKTSLRGDSK